MSKEKQSDEELSLDFDKIKKFFSNKDLLKIVSIIFFLAVPIIVSITLRAQPAYLPITDDWARNSIYSNIQSNIRAQLDLQYPNLPDDKKQQIVSDEFNKIIESGSINFGGQDVNIDEVIEQNSEFFKQKFQNEYGNTYLLAIDPYFYYRLTKNVVDHGYDGDYEDENGRYHDTKILAGQELGTGTDRKVSHFHILLQYYIYKLTSIFNPDADLMGVVFFTPLIIGTLAVIPAFFITRKIAGDIGGFIAGMFVAIHPAFLTRTAAGFSDTDAYNVFFPLLIIWLLIEALDSKDYVRAIIFSVLSAVSVGLFSYAWGGWFFILFYVFSMIFAVLAYHILLNWKTVLKKPKDFIKEREIKNLSIVTGTFTIIAVIVVSMFNSFSTITNLFKGTFKFIQLKDVGTFKIWPNVYTTVAELNPASLSTIISQISLGSKIWFFIGLLGLVISLISLKSDKKTSLYFLSGSAIWYLFLIIIQNSIKDHLFYAILLSLPIILWISYSIYIKENLDIKYSIILAVWFISTIYASSKGVRFILLLVPAFSIACGITAGIVSRTLAEWVSEELNVNKIFSYAVIVALFIALLFFPQNFVKASENTAKNEIPSMNDDWYGTLTKIRDESEPDAIINSWWDFGHWFAAIGERAVTLDGGRQNNAAAHWLGKLMLTWDERESVGILRYLDCGSNTGFNNLLPYLENDSLKTINTIYDIIIVDKDAAIEILKENGLDDEEIEQVIRYTHCEPPEDYFITSEDMVGKSGVWAHFGSWDFKRAVMYNKVHDKKEKEGISILTGEFGLNESEADRIFDEINSYDPDQWIAPWPSYASGLSSCSVSGEIVSCNNGLQFDLENEESTIPGASMNVRAVSYIDKQGDFKIKEYDENYITAQNGRPLGAALIPSGSSYQSVLMDYDLTGSMFTKLFYFEGYGLRYFDEFNNIRDITGAKIITWKIDWEGKDANIPEIVPETGEEISVTSIDDFDADAFSECLTKSGAKFYGTHTSTKCQEQIELLISENMPFIDCDIQGKECDDAGVTSYPSWSIGGVTDFGIKTLEELSEQTGCDIIYTRRNNTIDNEKEEELANPHIETEEPLDESDERTLFKIEHILIGDDMRTEAEALELAGSVYDMITDDNFTELASEYSECSDDTVRCSLGWFGKGVMSEEFEDEILKLKIGETSEPFKTSFGYEIVKLIDTK